MAFVPTSDCRFNCHGMIYVSEGKLQTFSCWRPLCSVAPLFLSPAGGAFAPPAPPGHHATERDGAHFFVSFTFINPYTHAYLRISVTCREAGCLPTLRAM